MWACSPLGRHFFSPCSALLRKEKASKDSFEGKRLSPRIVFISEGVVRRFWLGKTLPPRTGVPEGAPLSSLHHLIEIRGSFWWLSSISGFAKGGFSGCLLRRKVLPLSPFFCGKGLCASLSVSYPARAPSSLLFRSIFVDGGHGPFFPFVASPTPLQSLVLGNPPRLTRIRRSAIRVPFLWQVEICPFMKRFRCPPPPFEEGLDFRRAGFLS